jgi:hypothetical protein
MEFFEAIFGHDSEKPVGVVRWGTLADRNLFLGLKVIFLLAVLSDLEIASRQKHRTR